MTKTIRDILDTDNLNIRGTVLFPGHATHSVPCSYSLAVPTEFRVVSFPSELRDAVLNNDELGEDWDELHLESLKQIYDQMAETGKKIR